MEQSGCVGKSLKKRIAASITNTYLHKLCRLHRTERSSIEVKMKVIKRNVRDCKGEKEDMKSWKKVIMIMLCWVLCSGAAVCATDFQKLTTSKKKIGSNYMWIDKNKKLQIQNASTKKRQTLYLGRREAISDGKTIYMLDRQNAKGKLIRRYSLQDQTGRCIAYLNGINNIEGVYQNMLILSGARSSISALESLYAYDMNTWKLKKISSYSSCIGAYHQYFIFKGYTGAVTAVKMGVYDAKRNRTKILAKEAWCILQKGKMIYYVQDVGKAANSYRKMKVYVYDLVTGKKKAVSSTVTVAQYMDKKLTQNRFTYYGKNRKRHTVYF